jgi:hypothetical protein
MLMAGCESGTTPPPIPPVDAGPPSEACGSVRLTAYSAGPSGWCEVDRTLPVLPAFVRQGLTAAIAEPWNGGSYRGEPGEGCGECWEIDTITDTRIVMITDLCPIEGNPLCAGGHFHIDLALEAGMALRGGALDEAQARRVPCPVEGNMHVLVNDENVTYLRFAMLNHRVPIRSVEVRGAGPGVSDDNEWTPARRSGGAWEAIGEGRDLARGGTGVVFRVTSAQGQVVESTVIVPAHPPRRSTFDLGIQLDDLQPPSGGACEFVPPGDIYVDGWGGIDEVRWQINPWGEAEAGFFGEVNDACHSGTCVRVEQLAQWTGFHLYYRQAFPTSTFSRVTLRARTMSGQGMIQVAPSHDGERCEGRTFEIGETYTDIAIDLADVCAGRALLSALTIDNPGPRIALVIDDVRYER